MSKTKYRFTYDEVRVIVCVENECPVCYIVIGGKEKH